MLEFLNEFSDHHGIQCVVVARITVQPKHGAEQRVRCRAKQLIQIIGMKVEKR